MICVSLFISIYSSIYLFVLHLPYKYTRTMKGLILFRENINVILFIAVVMFE